MPGPATRGEVGASVVSEDEEELELVRTATASSDTGTVVRASTKQSPGHRRLGLDKITSWSEASADRDQHITSLCFRFKSSLDSGNKKGSAVSTNGGKAARRNSEGSKGSGLASRVRRSFREVGKRASIGSGGRPRTTSVGSMPSKENTPLGSLNVTGRLRS